MGGGPIINFFYADKGGGGGCFNRERRGERPVGIRGWLTWADFILLCDVN